VFIRTIAFDSLTLPIGAGRSVNGILQTMAERSRSRSVPSSLPVNQVHTCQDHGHEQKVPDIYDFAPHETPKNGSNGNKVGYS